MQELDEIVARIRDIVVQTDYEDAMNLWLEHLATDEEFLLNSIPSEDSKETILNALNIIIRQVFQGRPYVLNSISLRKNVPYQLVHGGGFIDEANFVLFYFPDLEVGCVLFNSNRTYYIRISKMEHPFDHGGLAPSDDSWN